MQTPLRVLLYYTAPKVYLFQKTNTVSYILLIDRKFCFFFINVLHFYFKSGIEIRIFLLEFNTTIIQTESLFKSLVIQNIITPRIQKQITKQINFSDSRIEWSENDRNGQSVFLKKYEKQMICQRSQSV